MTRQEKQSRGTGSLQSVGRLSLRKMLPLYLLCLLWLGARPSHAQDLPHPPGEGPKLVCYHNSNTEYRTGKGKFTTEDIDPFLCTHLIYGYAQLDDMSLTMKPASHKNGYERVVNLKKKNRRLKVLLSLWGWAESYSKMVADDHSRQEFVLKAVETLKLYRFDGLDLLWEFPVCWQGRNCSAGPASDKDNFSKLLKELRKAFHQEKPPLLLTAAVSAGKYIADNSYDADSLNKYLDFVNVMAFGLHSHWDGKTGHPAPLDQQPEDLDKYKNVIAAMKYWNQERGVANEKLILGMSTYGRSFTLANSSLHGLNAPSNGSGIAGEYIRQLGSLSYPEVLERIEQRGWTMVRVPGVGPYAYGGDQWVGFDDPTSAREKARLVRSQCYGGVMVFDLASDDFNATWSPTRSPLINSIKEELFQGIYQRGGNGSRIALYPCAGSSAGNKTNRAGSWAAVWALRAAFLFYVLRALF